MTFFEHQHVARRNTRVMVALFVLAVVGVVVAIDAIIASIFVMSELAEMPDGAHYHLIDVYLSVPAPVYLWGAGITFTLIVVESIRQTFKLRSGGEAIAAAFGARRVAPDSGDPLAPAAQCRRGNGDRLRRARSRRLRPRQGTRHQRVRGRASTFPTRSSR